MTPDERRAFRDEGLDPVRRATLRASADTVRAWDATHPITFDAYLDFLTEVCETFGPFPRADESVDATKLRL